MSQEVDVIIIGAGVAGLSAARQAARQGLSCKVLEASHRIGGRAYTEELAPGSPFDLGCHWMHSASVNPFVAIADALGHPYAKAGDWRNRIWTNGEWAADEFNDGLLTYVDAADAAIAKAAAAGNDVSIADVIDLDSPFCSVYAYWNTLETSRDIDQVSVFDVVNYNETNENWPLRNGYGTLVADWGKDVAVELNTAVEKVSWGGKSVRVETTRGTVTGKRAVITVSTNILNSDRIAFDPPLPDWKMQAAHNLPLGVHNRIGIQLNHNPFGEDAAGENDNSSVMITPGDEDATPMAIKIRPFGYDQVVGVTGGRHGEWLSKAGVAASVDHVTNLLVAAYGSDVRKALSDRSIVTAWETDPWVMGAYSAAMPGHGNDRSVLRKPLDDRLHFAGEATSRDFFSTAHGALITGKDAIDDIVAATA